MIIQRDNSLFLACVFERPESKCPQLLLGFKVSVSRLAHTHTPWSTTDKPTGNSTTLQSPSRDKQQRGKKSGHIKRIGARILHPGVRQKNAFHKGGHSHARTRMHMQEHTKVQQEKRAKKKLDTNKQRGD